ncbi:hypothetical protein [Glycomyces buryatensis]|uniref:SMI1/KNR4 family protein n=1 Tax=Glycomyces buryatensis TaxID=2570927 RepID=A0A4S8QJM4_9ACTN|nr:hypothetical protein [Glycomyces buryatensis]THV40934.1 hypothetical protein FAB82_13880 [Glycomyces buryatensis]
MNDDDFDSLQDKVAELRSSLPGMRTRWDASPDEYEFVEIGDGAALSEPDQYPQDLNRLNSLFGSATFGAIDFDGEEYFEAETPVDFNGDRIDDIDWIRIGTVNHEDSILVDKATGRTMVYFLNYGKYGWDNGVMIDCPSPTMFVDTVCFGPRYREIEGPVELQAESWWEDDPWYNYLRERGYHQ